MKASIAVALVGLVLAGAHGPAEGMEIIGRTANYAGGEMLLTSAKCAGYQNGNIIISSGPGGGESIHGCAWKLPPDRLYISWDHGETTVLPLYFEEESAPQTSPSRRPARIYQ